MIKLKNILLEDRLDAMKDRLKLSDDDILYLKSLNVPDKYIIWLANQYTLNTKQHGSNERFKEDAYKYEEALQKFFELSTKNKITNKNINNYKDIFALYDVIEKFDDVKSKRELEKDIKLEGAEKIFENDKWLVVIPRTKEAACYYGKGTKWCTSSTKGINYFNDYNKQGDLYIFVNKKDSNERYQLHIETTQFMDILDYDYDINKFKNNNPELVHIFDMADNNAAKNFIKNNKLKYNNETGRYDCDDNVTIPRYLVKNGKLLISFGYVYGYFDCSSNELITLEGCPLTVGGNFDCTYNKLKTLEGAPQKVDGDFHCSDNQLITLEGGPQTVGGNFQCQFNKLITLEGAPHTINRDFNCVNNNLKSLKGAPQTVGGNFQCQFNKLETLEGSPKKVGGGFSCYHNKLRTLKGAPYIVDKDFYCSHNQLETVEGVPQIINGSFHCNNNNLETLKGGPQKVGGNFNCSHNKLITLEECPQTIHAHFYCHHNDLKTLEGAPRTVSGDFYCYDNQLKSLKGAPQTVGGDFYCYNNIVKFTENDVRNVTNVLINISV